MNRSHSGPSLLRHPFRPSRFSSCAFVFALALLLAVLPSAASADFHEVLSLKDCTKETINDGATMSATIAPLKVTTTASARGEVLLTCTRTIPARFGGSPLPVTLRVSGKIDYGGTEGTGGALKVGIGVDKSDAIAGYQILATKSSGVRSKTFAKSLSADGAVGSAGDGSYRTVIVLFLRDSWIDMAVTATFAEFDLVSSTICGDADGDGAVTVLDALLILRKAVGQDVDCPAARCSVVSSLTARIVLASALQSVDAPVLLSCPTGA